MASKYITYIMRALSTAVYVYILCTLVVQEKINGISVLQYSCHTII